MANDFELVTVIAKRALLKLRETTYMQFLANRAYKDEAGNVGDTVKIRRPHTFVANDMAANGAVVTQDIVDETMSVKIDQWKETTVQIGDLQSTVNNDARFSRLIEDLATPLVSAFESDGIEALTHGISAQTSLYGTTTGSLTPSIINQQVRRKMRANNVPLDRMNLYGLVCGDDESALLESDKLTNTNYGQDRTEGIRNAAMGKIYGYELFPSNLTSSPTIVDASGAVNNGAGYPIGTTTLTVDGFIAAPPKGALITIGSDPNVYTVGTGSTTTSLVLHSGLIVAATDNDAITLLDVNQNVFFHRDAVVMVSIPNSAAKTIGEEKYPGAIVTTVQLDGIIMRAEFFRDSITKKNGLTLDLLYGWEIANEKLAVKAYTQKQ